MLSDEVIDKVIERLVDRIEEANTYTLSQIGKSIKKIGTLSPSDAQKLAQVLKYGGDYDKIVKKLAEITDLNIRDIYTIFDEVAKNDYNFAKQFYDYRGMKFVPYEENINLKNQVRALANITANEYFNITRTLGFATRDEKGRIIYTDLTKTFQNALDEAVLSVAQGKETFEQQMYRTIKELGESGIRTIDYSSGRSMRVDSAVRMNMKSGLRNLHNEMQEQIGEEFGADGVEISVHLNPAPDHAEVQGKQFSKEEFNKFQNDEEAVSYDGEVFPPEHDGRDRRSISQYNCYHYIFSIVLGISEPQYSSAQLKDIIDSNEKGFDLDGKHYTNYEGTQMQRQLETKIREQKDIQIAGREAGNDDVVRESQKKITELNKKYKQLSEVSGLPTKKNRLRVSGYKRTKA